MKKKEIDTPALLLNLDLFEANIFQMARYFEGIRANLRPHVKTHKTPMIAKKQIEAGAKGITCAKLGEAEVMANHQIENILIANQIVGKQKIKRLIKLTKRADLIVAVTDHENVRNLSLAAEKEDIKLDVIIEVEVGMNRCGTAPGLETLELARGIVKIKNLNFRGIMGYEGHVMVPMDIEERRQKTLQADKLLVDTAKLIENTGIKVEIVSAGGTGTFDITGNYPGITEVQAGSYCLMDSSYREYKNLMSKFQCAVTVYASVIGRPTAERVVVDTGLKSISIDQGIPYPKEKNFFKVVELHEEHMCLELKRPDLKIDIGDKIEFIPSHICTTVNLHDKFYCIRGNELKEVWDIEARGKSQ
ncbi:MAG: DSD1 family PLP-dependent enzyme [bacterium]|nr:DSD1 family PLP-dependent enzyme [bacterium]